MKTEYRRRRATEEHSRTIDSFGLFVLTLNLVGWATLLAVVWLWWRP